MSMDTYVFETDPTGRDPHSSGAKLDAGKPEPELIQRGFAQALAAVAEVGTYGARKYTPDGWQDVPDGVRRYTNALYRHLSAEHRGEQCDRDTDLLHAAHSAWNALARLELLLREQEALNGAEVCGCWECSDSMRRATTMILCPECGNKRCPRATNHRYECTGSNEPGQPGSRYSAEVGRD